MYCRIYNVTEAIDRHGCCKEIKFGPACLCPIIQRCQCFYKIRLCRTVLSTHRDHISTNACRIRSILIVMVKQIPTIRCLGVALIIGLCIRSKRLCSADIHIHSGRICVGKKQIRAHQNQFPAPCSAAKRNLCRELKTIIPNGNTQCFKRNCKFCHIACSGTIKSDLFIIDF